MRPILDTLSATPPGTVDTFYTPILPTAIDSFSLNINSFDPLFEVENFELNNW
jgi:hypothetical protein